MRPILIDRPKVQQFLGIAQGIRNVHLGSFCIGARNALAGVGALIGLWLVNYGDPSIGTTADVVSCAYMLLASLFMGLADVFGYSRPGWQHQGDSRVVAVPSDRTRRDHPLGHRR